MRAVLQDPRYTIEGMPVFCSQLCINARAEALTMVHAASQGGMEALEDALRGIILENPVVEHHIQRAAFYIPDDTAKATLAAHLICFYEAVKSHAVAYKQGFKPK